MRTQPKTDPDWTPPKERAADADDPAVQGLRELLLEQMRQAVMAADPTLLPDEARSAPLTGRIARPVVKHWDWTKGMADSETLSTTAKAVLYAIATWMNADGTRARPPREKIAKRTSIRSLKTVQNALDESREKGFLTWVSGGGRKDGSSGVANRYTPLLPPRTAAWHVLDAYMRLKATGAVATPLEPPNSVAEAVNSVAGAPNSVARAPNGVAGAPLPDQDQTRTRPPHQKPLVVLEDLVKSLGGDLSRWKPKWLDLNAQDVTRLDGWAAHELRQKVGRLPDDIDPAVDHDRLGGLLHSRLQRVTGPPPSAMHARRLAAEEAEREQRRREEEAERAAYEGPPGSGMEQYRAAKRQVFGEEAG